MRNYRTNSFRFLLEYSLKLKFEYFRKFFSVRVLINRLVFKFFIEIATKFHYNETIFQYNEKYICKIRVFLKYKFYGNLH